MRPLRMPRPCACDVPYLTGDLAWPPALSCSSVGVCSLHSAHALVCSQHRPSLCLGEPLRLILGLSTRRPLWPHPEATSLHFACIINEYNFDLIHRILVSVSTLDLARIPENPSMNFQRKSPAYSFFSKMCKMWCHK